MIHRILNRSLPFALLTLSAGCEAPPEPVREKPYRPPDPWSHQQEEIFQTREVINYLDEQHTLKLRELDELGVLPPQTPDQQGQHQAAQEQPNHQPVPPAHEGG